MEPEKIRTSLPENAYRELRPGEQYRPMMPASASPREVTAYSVAMGLAMPVIFSAAAAYLGLKVGQVFEAAIPIAIIAVGLGNMLGKKNIATEYFDKARAMAAEWEKMADDGDHYRLTFDRAGPGARSTIWFGTSSWV